MVKSEISLTLCWPPKFCINHCFQILLRTLHIPKNIWFMQDAMLLMHSAAFVYVEQSAKMRMLFVWRVNKR